MISRRAIGFAIALLLLSKPAFAEPVSTAHRNRTIGFALLTGAGLLLGIGTGVLSWHSTQVLRDLHETAPSAPTLADFNQQVLQARAQSSNESSGAIGFGTVGLITLGTGVTLLGLEIGGAL